MTKPQWVLGCKCTGEAWISPQRPDEGLSLQTLLKYLLIGAPVKGLTGFRVAR